MGKILVFATHNSDKYLEIKRMIPEGLTLFSLNELALSDPIPEKSETLEGNALQKVQYVRRFTQYDCFADDTGLEVESLGGKPGVYSARFAGENATYGENVNLLLKEMKGKANRRARFITVIALLWEGNTYFFKGIARGMILDNIRGSAGFGYDPVFLPEGKRETYAEMATEEKNQISHRGKAFKKMLEFLEDRMQ